MAGRSDTRRGVTPHVILEDELGRCLCFLDVEPAAYPRVARQWAARLLYELPLSLEDARLLLGALEELANAERSCRGRALVALLERQELWRAAQVLRAWLDTPVTGP